MSRHPKASTIAALKDKGSSVQWPAVRVDLRERRRDFDFGGDGGLGVGLRPGQELTDARGRPAVHELFQHIGEVGFRVYAVEAAALDERSDTCPSLGTFIATGEQGVLAVQVRWGAWRAPRHWYRVRCGRRRESG